LSNTVQSGRQVTHQHRSSTQDGQLAIDKPNEILEVPRGNVDRFQLLGPSVQLLVLVLECLELVGHLG
jgi:hypothetical protein